MVEKPKKPKRLTAEDIARINREVDQEFAHLEEVEP